MFSWLRRKRKLAAVDASSPVVSPHTPEKETTEKSPEKDPEKGPDAPEKCPEKDPEKETEKGPEDAPEKGPEDAPEKDSARDAAAIAERERQNLERFLAFQARRKTIQKEAQAQANDAQASDAQASDAQASDAQASDAQASDAQASDAQAVGRGVRDQGSDSHSFFCSDFGSDLASDDFGSGFGSCSENVSQEEQQQKTPRRSFEPIVGNFYLHKYTEGRDATEKLGLVKVYKNRVVNVKKDIRHSQIEWWAFAYTIGPGGERVSQQKEIGVSDEDWVQVKHDDLINYNNWRKVWVDTDTLQDPDADMSTYNPRLMFTAPYDTDNYCNDFTAVNPPGLAQIPKKIRKHYPARYSD